MLEKHGVASDLIHGFDWSPWTGGTTVQKFTFLPTAQEHVLE